MMVSAPGHEAVTTHLFVEDSPYLDSDAVFGVRDSLIVEFERHEPGTATDGRKMNEPYHVAHYDFRLVPAERSLRMAMKIGKSTVPRTAISTSDEHSITVRGEDLCRDLIGRMSFTDYFCLLVTGQRARRAAQRPCSMPRWWRSPSTASCPACRPAA